MEEALPVLPGVPSSVPSPPPPSLDEPAGIGDVAVELYSPDQPYLRASMAAEPICQVEGNARLRNHIPAPPSGGRSGDVKKCQVELRAP